MVSVVFEAVEVLVAFPADIASMGFGLFHTQRAGVGVKGFRVNDGEGTIFVGSQLLRVVSVLWS